MAKKTAVQITAHKIGSVAELDETLSEIAQLKSRVQKKQAAYNEKEQARREELTKEITPDQERIKDLENALEIYCVANRHEFPKGKKTLELTHGIVSFRESPPAVKARKKFTLSSCMELIKCHPNQAIYAEFIRRKEELNKEYILAEYNSENAVVTDEVLSTVGLEVTNDEKFYYVTKLASEVM